MTSRAVSKKADKTGRVRIVGASNDAGKADASRHSMRRGSRRVLVLGVVFVLVLLFSVCAPTYITEFRFTSMATYLSDMASNLASMLSLFAGSGNYTAEVKLAGMLVGAVSGAALGMCGSAYQGAFNNNLAAPKTLGVMAGGALGALLWVMVFQESLTVVTPNSRPQTTTLMADVEQWVFNHDKLGWFLGKFGEPLFSVIGCLLVVALVVGVTRLVGRGRYSNIIVIVCGQIIAGAVTGVITFCRYVCSVNGGIDMADQLAEIENYVILDHYTFGDLPIILIPILACIVVLLLMRNRLTLLSFGDEEAYSMGVNVKRTRTVLIVVATVMTAWAISFCGHVAFLGFISAHIARKVVGPDFKFLLPASLFTGGGLLTLVYYLCQSGIPYTSPYSAGTICSIVGGCIFLLMALVEGRRAHAAHE